MIMIMNTCLGLLKNWYSLIIIHLFKVILVKQ